MRSIEYIIIHCSDSDIPAHDDIEVIKGWHLQRGFANVGYHFYFNQEGKMQIGRNIKAIGAHAKGYNSNSVGICMGGRNKFSSKQLIECCKFVAFLCTIFKLKPENVLGHYEVNKNKTCPNTSMCGFRKKLKEYL